MLGRAGRLSPGGLRAAIARAVDAVAPDKARKRREDAARDARVERWPEDSGNAGLAGRELPPDRVLAMDQRITWWARQLQKAGLEGEHGRPARPRLPGFAPGHRLPPRHPGSPAATDARADSRQPAIDPARPGLPGPPDPAAAGIRVIPAGFTGRDPPDRPAGHPARPGRPARRDPRPGPVDPWLARDLAAASAASPKTSWCLTVTDGQGHAIGHACARPEPRTHGKRGKPGPPGGPVPPAARVHLHPR